MSSFSRTIKIDPFPIHSMQLMPSLGSALDQLFKKARQKVAAQRDKVLAVFFLVGVSKHGRVSFSGGFVRQAEENGLHPSLRLAS